MIIHTIRRTTDFLKKPGVNVFVFTDMYGISHFAPFFKDSGIINPRSSSRLKKGITGRYWLSHFRRILSYEIVKVGAKIAKRSWCWLYIIQPKLTLLIYNPLIQFYVLLEQRHTSYLPIHYKLSMTGKVYTFLNLFTKFRILYSLSKSVLLLLLLFLQFHIRYNTLVFSASRVENLT